jgi:hypothetical protein
MIVDILGHATLCYSSKWLLTKAKMIALLAIQIARLKIIFIIDNNFTVSLYRSKHGKNHPAFIKALLCYGYFSNEFIQDEGTIFLAKVYLYIM